MTAIMPFMHVELESDPILLTVRETAQALSRPEYEIRQLIREGVIPSVRLSPRRVRVPRFALETWLEEKTRDALAGLVPSKGAAA